MTDQRAFRYFSAIWMTAPQRIVFAFGVWFTFGNYVAGTLIWPSTIADPNEMHMMHVFGFIPVMVNGWHLYFHLLTGLACLWLATTRGGATVGALAVGATYALVGAVGLLVDGNVFGLIMADTFGNWVHLAESAGLLATAIGAMTSREDEATVAVP